MWLQRLFTIALILGTTGAIFLKQDIFPFSNYPMYSQPFNPEKGQYRHEIKGVNNKGIEVDVNVWRHMPPFWKSSLRESLLVEYEKEVVRSKLKAMLHYYNNLSHIRNDESLSALRIYRFKLDWPKIVADVKEDGKFSGELGPNSELFLEVSK